MRSAAAQAEPVEPASRYVPIARDEQVQSYCTGLGGEANWLWLAPDIGRACALVIGDITPSHRRGLAARFDRVDHTPLVSLERIVAVSGPRPPGARQLSYDDGCLDCVLSGDLVNKWSGPGRSPFRDPHFAEALSEIRRLLRPGGCLFLSGRNARWFGALRRRGEPSLHVGAARTALAQAGFSETRAYFADPFSVVPACRPAACAYERLPGADSALRAWWAAGGLYQLLYRDAFVLAIK